MEKKAKGKRGITLIALIITIILMLILSGVAISAITADGIPFGKIKNIAGQYNDSVEEEQNAIDKIIREMNNYYIDESAGEDNLEGALLADIVKVGDYVNYDAGEWTQADIDKITASEGSPTVTGTESLPTTHKQFGGFTIGQSRNSNSTQYVFTSTENVTYGEPRTNGWRVWDINDTTGEVTLISAGNPETYCHGSGMGHDINSSVSVDVLRNRNCSMYENSYAKPNSAHIITGQDAVTWYNKQYNTNYNVPESGLEGYTIDETSFCYATLSTVEPISVLENGTYFWLATKGYSNAMLGVSTYNCSCISYNGYFGPYGIRVLVTLESKAK